MIALGIENCVSEVSLMTEGCSKVKKLQNEKIYIFSCLVRNIQFQLQGVKA